MVLEGTIFGSTENLSNQGSLKNGFLKDFFKELIMVSQRTFKMLLWDTIYGSTKNLSKTHITVRHSPQTALCEMF